VFVPFTQGCSEELYGYSSILDDARLPTREKLPGQRMGTALPCSVVSLTAITACGNCANSNCYLASKSDGYALPAASAAGLALGLTSDPSVRSARRLLSDFSPDSTREIRCALLYRDHAALGREDAWSEKRITVVR